jgi:hypothetical protein
VTSDKKEVHHHACGEHIRVPTISPNSNGSSPRMWEAGRAKMRTKKSEVVIIEGKLAVWNVNHDTKE